MDRKPAVVIVGAGAMGLVAGYHLSLAGAAVTFLVRPARLAMLASPQILYCYNDAQLKTFSDYRAVASIADCEVKTLDYVLVTMDGASSRTDDGRQLLSSIGDAIRGSATRLIIGGVGVGLREHFLQQTRLPPDRILEGVLGLLSYQVDRADLHLSPPVDAKRIAQAGMAYVQFPSKVGFVMSGASKKAAKEFAALYNRCGVSRCTVILPRLFNVISNMPFPLFAISEIAGWPSSADLANHKELWTLNRRAQAEIMGLKQHGVIGKLMRLLMTEKMHLRLLQKLERDSLPMDFIAFNRFHHGGKVQAQDIEIMQNCVAAGKAQGFAMPALQEVLAQLDAYKHSQTQH